MHDELGTYSTQGIATIGLENAVSGLARHRRSLPLARIRDAVLLEPGIVVGEVYCADAVFRIIRNSIVGPNAIMLVDSRNFSAVLNGAMLVALVLLLGTYMVIGNHTNTSRRRVQRAFLAGAGAAAGNGVIMYTCEGTFAYGMALLALISLTLPMRSMIGMRQRRRTTLFLNRHAGQAHLQELAIDS